MRPNYEIRVGLFALFALIVFVWGWSWLKSFNIFHAPQKFGVRFHDVAGLNNNATVNINGVRVGTIQKVELISKGEVVCHVRITAEKVVVTRGSNFTIQTLGLVGAKYMEITLAEPKAGEPPPQPLSESDVVNGQDPVRVELVLNDIATRVARVVRSVRSEKAGTSLAEALEHSGEAVKNINEASEKLNKNMDKFAQVADCVEATSEKIGLAADKAGAVESSAKTFFKAGTTTMDSVNNLSCDLRGAAGKINNILDHPGVSGDLKDTAEKARQTAKMVSQAMHELNTTLQDKGVRQDVMSILERVDASTANITKSLDVVKSMSADHGLRNDIKQIVGNAREAMDKFDGVVSEPGFKNDIRTTITKVRSAADHVDFAARQLSQVLNRRAPLLHMMFGRPGHIAKEAPETSPPEDRQKMQPLPPGK